MGISFSHRTSHPRTTVQEFPVKSGTTDLSGGCLGNLESGAIDRAASGDTALVGLVLSPCDPTHDLAALPSGAKVKVIVDEDAVYRTTDNNVRAAGATLDLDSEGDGLTTSSNADVVVTAPSTATEPTYFKIAKTQHYTAKV